jgi:hypothetical protein
MDVYDNLIVRICKSKKPTIKKLRRIWEMRCGLYRGYCSDAVDLNLAHHLLEMVLQTYNVIPEHQLIPFLMDNCQPEHQKFIHSLGLEGNSSVNCFIRACVSKLRLAKADKFEGYRAGARWAKRHTKAERVCECGDPICEGGCYFKKV